ncbi:transposase-like protein [Fibrobacter sp. UWS1]|nr:transposase-like protein [Fibrobacter sp. UWS1]
MTHEEYKEMIKKAASQFKTGKPIFGKDGAFHQVLEDFLNAALEAEMDVHLEKTKPENRENRRNGKMPKEIKTAYGAVQINTPRDREGSFNPEIVKKRQTVLAEGLADRIIGLYGLGQSMRDIQKYLEDDFGEYISADTISNITERVWPEINEWRTRRLETVYPIVWMDAIHYKVKDESGIVTTRAIYNVIGVDSNGYKDLLGMYVSQSEGAKFWMQVLSDLKNRGVEDILIACVDGLSGFPDAIESVFPKTNVQLCVVHQIRNSLKYINAKSQKEFLKELKLVYAASTKTEAEIALKKLEENWAKKGSSSTCVGGFAPLFLLTFA